jgi:hypothetical protein
LGSLGVLGSLGFNGVAAGVGTEDEALGSDGVDGTDCPWAGFCTGAGVDGADTGLPLAGFSPADGVDASGVEFDGAGSWAGFCTFLGVEFDRSGCWAGCCTGLGLESDAVGGWAGCCTVSDA